MNRNYILLCFIYILIVHWKNLFYLVESRSNFSVSKVNINKKKKKNESLVECDTLHNNINFRDNFLVKIKMYVANIYCFPDYPVEEELVKITNRNIALINYIDNNNINDFRIALKNMSEEELNYRIESYGGETLLTYIAKKKNCVYGLEFFIYLCQSGARIGVSNSNKESPLLLSIKNLNIKITNYIITVIKRYRNIDKVKQYISAIDVDEISALIYAIRSGQLNLALDLIEFGESRLHNKEEHHILRYLEEFIKYADYSLYLRLITHLLKTQDVLYALNYSIHYAFKYKRIELIPFLASDILNRQSQLKKMGVHSIQVAKPISDKIILSIHEAMENEVPEKNLLPLIYLGVSFYNVSLCNTANREGYTLLFQAIKKHYVDISRILIRFAFERYQSKNDIIERCDLDKIFHKDEYISEILISDPLWYNHYYGKSLLEKCLLWKHPITGRNTLQVALSDKTRAETIFNRIGIPAANRYGVNILKLASIDKSRLDTLAIAITLNSETGIIGIIINWLVSGMDDNIKYKESLKNGILLAAGKNVGYTYFKKQSKNQDVLRIASVLCPEFVNDIVSNYKINSSADEEVFVNLLNSIPRYINSKKVMIPLTHIISMYFSQFNLLYNLNLINDLLGGNNFDSISPIDLDISLDILGNTSGECSNEARYQYLSKFHNQNSIEMLKGIGSTQNDFTYYQTDIFYTFFFKNICRLKKSIMLYKLLKLTLFFEIPLFKNNLLIICLCINILGILYIYSVWHTLNNVYNIPNSAIEFIEDFIPNPRNSWIMAIIESLRKVLSIPNSKYFYWYSSAIDSKNTPYTRLYYYDRHVIILMIYKIMFSLSIQFFIIVFLLEKTFKDRYFGSIRMFFYEFKFNLVIIAVSLSILTVLSKFTTKKQAMWMKCMILGLEPYRIQHKNASDRISSIVYTKTLYALYWLPQSERKFLSYIRNLQLSSSETRDSIILTLECINQVLFSNNSGHKDEWVTFSLVEKNKAPENKNFSLVDAGSPISNKEKYNRYLCITGKTNKNSKSYLKSKSILKIIFNDFQYGQRSGINKNVVYLNIITFLLAQFKFLCLFKKMQILYYEYYRSLVVYKFFKDEKLWICVMSNIIIFLVEWRTLVLIGHLIILSIRISDVMQRSSTILSEKCHLTSILEGLTDLPQLNNKMWSLRDLKTYIDIRQCLFKQFEYVWKPIKYTLNYLFILNILSIIIIIKIGCTNKWNKPVFFLNYYKVAVFQIYNISLLLWLLIKAVRANYISNQGWEYVKQLYILPSSENMDKTSKRIIFEAINFFKKEEFKLEFVLSKFNTTFLMIWTLILIFLTFHIFQSARNIIWDIQFE